jgi:hypothetical protein
MGGPQGVYGEYGDVKRCPIGLGLSSILAYRALMYVLRRKRTATILQHPSLHVAVSYL